MASTTRGSIKLSTANGIGAALVDVLGGEGYKPDDWEQNINLCGVHAADIESALENIEEDAGTGTERGSILLSTANAIGATLNKKFNTSRGFSPREWASAVSKLEPLPERTASGSIAHIENGASEVPLKNWLVTLPASLSGYSAIVGTQINSDNLMGFPSVDFTYKNVRYYTVDGVLYLDGTSTGETSPVIDEFKVLSFTLKAGTYYFNRGALALPSGIYKKSDGTQLRVNNGSFTLAEDTECNLGFYVYNKSFSNQKADVCLNTGSTAITYTDTTAPTQYTASLGRTIYGGTADIVNGEGQETSIMIDLATMVSASAWNMGATDRFRTRLTQYQTASGWSGNWQNTVSNVFVCENPSTPFNNRSDYSFANIPQNYYNFDIKVPSGQFESVADFAAWLANTDGNGKHAIIVIDSATPTDFTFTPITPTPETALGVNNFWADEGDSAVTYRKDLDIPDPVPGNLLGMNNGNNEEESEG